MADIRLAKPAAGTTQTVPSAPNGRFIFDFPADAATLTRNGDDLVLTFEDGSSIQLQGFYTTYSKEEMPSFQVEGVEISGQDFFAALGEDLMPAAGPAASSASRSGRYNEYGGSDLLDGIDHLGRLDIGFDGGTQLATDTVEPSAPEVDIDYDVTIAAGPEAGAVDLTVYEGGLAGGSQAGQAATPTTASGSLNINAPDGVASIVIGDVVVYENGKLTGNVVTTDEGTLAVTGYDPVTGKLDFSYTLDRNTTEHDKSDPATDTQISHDLTVTVTDTDGDSDSTTITVNVVDDVPTVGSFSHDVTEGDTSVINGDALEGSAAGADGANFAWTDPAQQGKYGSITLNPDGSYSYTLNNDNTAVKDISDAETLTEEFTYTYTDADGDIAEGKVTITINGKDNGIVIEPTDPAAGSDTVTVYESGLADGSQAGQEGAPTTASGSLDITAPDGVKSITLTFGSESVVVPLDGTEVTLDMHGEGSLSASYADGKLSYTYTLGDNTLEHGPGDNDANSIGHEIGVMVTDTDDTTESGTITVNIVDDVPEVTLTDANASAQYGESVVIGTLTSDYGADGAHAVDGLELSINGVKGELSDGVYTFAGIGTATIDGEGKISFRPELGSGAQQDYMLSVTITDADGDKSSDEFEFSVEGTDVSISDVTLTTHDSETEGAASDRDSVTVTLPDGAKLVAGTYPVTNGRDGEQIGTLTVSEDGTITFVQDENYTAGTQGDDAAATDAVHTASINVTLVDGTVVENAFDVTVNIVDDVPTISVDKEASGAYGKEITGSVDIDFGADGEKSVMVSLGSESVTGVKGTDGNYTFTFKDGSKLTLNGETGDFSYDGVPASGTGTSYEFTFRVTDADGDTATATTTAELAPKVSYQSSVTSSDNDTLAEVTPVHSVNVPGMSGIREITDGAQVYQGDTLIGKFTLSGGTLFFTQLEAYTHDKDSNSVTLPHQLIVTDSDGREHIVAVDVTIQDSLPYAYNDTIELKEHGEQGVDAAGDVLVNDTLSADGATRVTGVQAVNGNPVSVTEDGVSIGGTLGTLHIRADGTYEYTLPEGVSIPDSSIVREEFTYTIMDADGDTSTAAALTILVGKGTVHVKESGIGINENGQKITIPGTLEAEGEVEGKVTDVEAGTTLYTDENIPDKFKLHVEPTETNGNIITIHTNYGDLAVDKATGGYTFTLDDDAANPLPNGFEIHQGFNFTTTVGDVNVTQEVVVVIEGTNDAGKLDESGEGGHDSNQLWIDAKAEGADSVERPYDAVKHPNIGDDDLGQRTDSMARPTAWLPFTLEDPDFGDSLTFHAVFNGAGNDHNVGASMEGTPFVSYQKLLQSMDTAPLSMALTVEWGKFQQNFTSEQLDGMLFCRTDYGIFAITNEAVELKELNNLEGAQYWLTFLVDSDSDVIRQMAEGTGTGASDYGKLLNFSFQVTDKTGNTVQTSTGSGSFADINHVLVHVYGSNDTPEVALSDGKLAVHDDDVTGYNKYGRASQTGGDRESHTITVEYNGETYTGTLEAGTMTLWSSGRRSITCDVTTGSGSGTNFIISNFKDGDQSINGQLAITITDMRDNSAMYMVNAQDGQLVDIPGSFTLTGTEESENLYGGSGADTLWGGGGNDSLWGGRGNDTLEGGTGNDRLYGEAGNDVLQGGDGLDILVGGDGDDRLDGGAGDDVIIGDGQGDLQSVIEDVVNAETFRDFLILKSPEELESYMSKFETQNDGKDTLDGGAGDDLLFGMGGDDILRGGDGNDLLFGGSGNDYLDGGAGEDTIFGGSGNDIIVYDSNDYLVSGGSGIDFMVSNDSKLTMEALLSGGKDGKEGPIVDSIEVLLKGEDALSLTSIQELADKYGITLSTNDKGEETLSLDDRWIKQEDGSYDFNGGAEADGGLTLETNLTPVEAGDPASEAVQQQVFTLEHSNG